MKSVASKRRKRNVIKSASYLLSVSYLYSTKKSLIAKKELGANFPQKLLIAKVVLCLKVLETSRFIVSFSNFRFLFGFLLTTLLNTFCFLGQVYLMTF